jgi:hypothetical protein
MSLDELKNNIWHFRFLGIFYGSNLTLFKTLTIKNFIVLEFCSAPYKIAFKIPSGTLLWWQRGVDARCGFIRLQDCLEAGPIVLCLKAALQVDKSASRGATKAPMVARGYNLILCKCQ